MDAVAEWRKRGREVDLLGHRIFTLDEGDPGAQPVVLLHGFPTCSFDWRHVVDDLAKARRVVALDFLGFGLSEKPLDRPYSLFEQADIVVAFLAELEIARCALMTHDMGDSVGGELLARQLEGSLPVEITARVITNGSIYMDLVALSAGQQLLLDLPDEAVDEASAPNDELVGASLAATFGEVPPTDEELQAQWELMSFRDGHRILPRTIRYVEERRVHEDRWTGAIEAHPSPLTIVWGDADPIARVAMAERLAERRPDAVRAILPGVGHYPMIESPGRFISAAASGLAL